MFNFGLDSKLRKGYFKLTTFLTPELGQFSLSAPTTALYSPRSDASESKRFLKLMFSCMAPLLQVWVKQSVADVSSSQTPSSFFFQQIGHFETGTE